ncbi:MAG: AI-2E family transporter [Rhodothermales bacterium]|nr:AI-2E family transporter [Rhodothermales bacterium]
MFQKSPAWMKLILLVALVVAAFYVVKDLGHVVRLLIVGGLLAYLLDPLARALEARGMSRSSATVLIFVGLVVVLAILVYALFPVVAAQVAGLRQGFDVTDVDRLLYDIDWVVNGILSRFGAGTVDVPTAAYDWLARQSGNLIQIIPNAFSMAVDVIIVPFIMFFLLRDGTEMKKTFISWLPNRYFEFALTVIHKSSRKLGAYLRGQATAALVVGILSSIALRLLGVDYYLIVGLFAGIANMVPYLGPFAGSALAVVVSALTTGGLQDAPWIILAFLLIQMVDNTLVQPLVLSRNVEMHPLGVLLAVIIGGQFFGIWGLLLAVPVAAVAKVVVSEFAGNLRRFRLT